MRIRPDKCVGISPWPDFLSSSGEDNPSQVFEIHLVHNTGVRGDHLKILKGILPPTKEGITLTVSGKLQVSVQLEGVMAPERVHLNRMVNYQLSRQEWVDLVWVSAKLLDRIPHSGEVHHCGNAGEILEQDTGGHERDFSRRFGLSVPIRQRFDIFRRDRFPILTAKQIFQQDFQGIREPCDVPSLLFKSRNPGDSVVFPTDF